MVLNPKMYLVLLFAAVALFGNTCRSASVNNHMRKLTEIDNNIDPNGISKSEGSSVRNFLQLPQRPHAVYPLAAGGMVELTCEAAGSPAPSIHWFKNDAPVYEYDIDTNELLDSDPPPVARITSTVLVTKVNTQDVYTCVVSAGSKTIRSTAIVYSTDDSTELSERSKLYPLAPRIVVSYKVYINYIGKNIVLPCRVKGHPKPRITWLDSKGAPVKNDPRMKVLRSGELVISSLRWSDMGEFTCRATNAFGTQDAKTFVYPAKEG